MVLSEVPVVVVEPAALPVVFAELPVVWFWLGVIWPALLDEPLPIVELLLPDVPALPACAIAMPNANVSTTARIIKRVLIKSSAPG